MTLKSTIVPIATIALLFLAGCHQPVTDSPHGMRGAAGQNVDPPFIPARTPGPFSERCEVFESNDFWEINTFLADRWRSDDPPGSPSGSFGVVALRNTTGTPWEGAWGPAIDWTHYPEAERPAIVEDYLCLATWRIENIENLTQGTFWTYFGMNWTIGRDTFDRMHAETVRQNGRADECISWIWFQDRRFGVEEAHFHIDRVYTPSSIRIGAIKAADSEDPEALSRAYIELKNLGDSPVQLVGWRIAGGNQSFTIDSELTLQPRSEIRFHTGRGDNATTEVYWQHSSRVWVHGLNAVVWDANGGLIHTVEVEHPPTAHRCVN